MVAWNSLLLIPRKFRATCARGALTAEIDRSLALLLLSRPVNLLIAWKPIFFCMWAREFQGPSVKPALKLVKTHQRTNSLSERRARGVLSRLQMHTYKENAQNRRSTLCELRN